MKIRTVIFAVYVAANAVGFFVLMRFMLSEVRPRYVTAVQQNLRDSARMVASALEGRTLDGARAALAGEAAFRVKLVAENGTVLFDSSGRLEDDADSGDYTERGIAKRAGARLIDGSPLSELEVSTTERFRTAEGASVRLVLSRSFRSVNAVIWAERKKLATISLAIAAVMVVAGWWITTKLTHSLERLTGHARAVRDGQLSTAPVSRVAEIAGLARAFEEMRDALEGRQHVERYTQALAHEVKAPLAAIRGAAELLDERMEPAQRARFLANIRSEAARIQQIIDRLLELSSLEARKALRQTEVMEAGQVLREAAEAVRPAYEAAGVKLELQPATASIRGERVLLREALVNLLQNALDFSPAGATVRAAIAAAAGRVTWTVEDAGPGVPEYALPRVFERFYSLPRPGTNRKSTGLGLALVWEIAHLHGGEARLANRPAGGASATLSLPTV